MNEENNLWIGPSYDTKLTFNLKCPKCGAIVNNYIKYCYECGEKIMIEVNTQDAQSEKRMTNEEALEEMKSELNILLDGSGRCGSYNGKHTDILITEDET